MAKESVWQRRARKCRSAKADYYPKVNLAEMENEARETSLAPERRDLPQAPPTAAAPTRAPEEAPPPPESLGFAAAPPPDASAPASDAQNALRLPEYLELSAATPLARALLERRGEPIVLDASSVQRVGAQCIQVLLSARRTWSADGVALSIVNCAPRMIEDLQLLGIDATTLTSGELPQ